jgi:hypothetical protein
MTTVNEYDEWINDVVNTTGAALVAAKVSAAANGMHPPNCTSTLQKKEQPFVICAEANFKIHL